MKYQQTIIDILGEAGPRGLPLMSVVKHVYNAHNTFFEPVSERNVYQSVRRFIVRQSQSANPLFIKGEDNKFRLNPGYTPETPPQQPQQERQVDNSPMLPFE